MNPQKIRLTVEILKTDKHKLFTLAHQNFTTMSGLIKRWIDAEWKKTGGKQ